MEHTEGFVSPNGPIIHYEDTSCNTHVRLHITKYFRDNGNKWRLEIDGVFVAEIFRGNVLDLPIAEGMHEINVNIRAGGKNLIQVFLKNDTDYLLWRDEHLVYHVTKDMDPVGSTYEIKPVNNIIANILLLVGLAIVILDLIKCILQS